MINIFISGPQAFLTSSSCDTDLTFYIGNCYSLCTQDAMFTLDTGAMDALAIMFQCLRLIQGQVLGQPSLFSRCNMAELINIIF